MPRKGKFVLLAAAAMGHLHDLGQVSHRAQVKTLHGVISREMLHVNRVPGSDQGPVKNGMGDSLVRELCIREIEAPFLDTPVPTGVDKGEVVLLPGKDEQAMGHSPQHRLLVVGRVLFIPLTALPLGAEGEVLRKLHGNAGDAVSIGFPLPLQRTQAVPDMHLGVGYREPLVQTGYPDQGRLASPLEMSRQIRHQRRGRDIHGPAFFQERRAEQRAFQLHDMEAGLPQRDPHHLEGLAAVWLRNDELFRAGAFQERRGAPGGANFTQPLDDLLFPIEREQTLFPLDGLIKIQLPCLDSRLHVAEGDREGRIAVQFDDAERGGEFGEGRKAIRADLKRKLAPVDGRPARIVGQFFRHIEDEGGFPGEGAFERNAAHCASGRYGLFALFVNAGQIRLINFLARLHDNLFGLVRRDRSGEIETHRQQRDAGSIGVHPVASEGNHKPVTHGESEDLVVYGLHPGGSGDARSPDKFDRRLAGKLLATAEG